MSAHRIQTQCLGLAVTKLDGPAIGQSYHDGGEGNIGKRTHIDEQYDTNGKEGRHGGDSMLSHI